MLVVGRHRKSNPLNLPPRMRFDGYSFYYDHGGSSGQRRWERLSRDVKEAKLKWAQIEADGRPSPAAGTFGALIDHYLEHVLPRKAQATQDLHQYQSEKLRKAFGRMKLSSIRPMHIAQYLDLNPKKIAANREVTLASVMYRIAIRKGWTDANPCTHVSRNPEQPRDRYIEDKEFLAVKSVAPAKWQAIMDMAYLTGMRQRDLRTLRLDQIEARGLRIKQTKTGRKQLFEWDDALLDAVERLKAAQPKSKRLRNVPSIYLIINRSKQPYTRMGFGAVFRKLVAKAIKDELLIESFHFHDIRAKSATDADEQGLDPQRLCGHTTRKQTEIYLRSKKTLVIRPVALKFGK